MNFEVCTNILFTGGRAPVTLDLARLFASAGYRVFVADSMQHQLCSLSRCVCENFFVPSPRHDYPGYIQALEKIIQEQKIDLLIPTCEEIFYISHALPRLSQLCQVCAESLDRLDRLHNKWEFIQLAQNQNLQVPQTWFLKTSEDLDNLIQTSSIKLIFKPVYSRFANHIHTFNPDIQNRPDITITPTQPWVAQEYIIGQHYSSYSIAHRGQITAHAVYPSIFTAGKGACIYFESIDHPGIFTWVNKFITAINFTGQIAFDWIENQNGELYPLECNPRTISAIHLFTPTDNLPQAFISLPQQIIQPQPQRKAMISMAMLIYGLPSAIGTNRVKKWLKIFLKTPDVIFRSHDPLPFLSIWIILIQALITSFQTKQNLQQVSTQDIEWDGEEIGSEKSDF